jgi:hypothetical protein
MQYVNTDKEGDRRIGITGDLSMGRRFSIFLDDFSTFFPTHSPEMVVKQDELVGSVGNCHPSTPQLEVRIG